jgi:glyceraldehyde-3-phosphate dehydrogenase (NADP+)
MMLTSQQLKELFPENSKLKDCGVPPQFISATFL